jgi:hypothetical protein
VHRHFLRIYHAGVVELASHTFSATDAIRSMRRCERAGSPGSQQSRSKLTRGSDVEWRLGTTSKSSRRRWRRNTIEIDISASYRYRIDIVPTLTPEILYVCNPIEVALHSVGNNMDLAEMVIYSRMAFLVLFGVILMSARPTRHCLRACGLTRRVVLMCVPCYSPWSRRFRRRSSCRQRCFLCIVNSSILQLSYFLRQRL